MPTLPDRTWAQLTRARVDLDDLTVCLCASVDRDRPALNYDQCFVRDFAVCAPAFLLRGEADVVKRFLETVVRLQMREHAVEAFRPRRGLMPASFRPVEQEGEDVLRGDYGEESIARVTPVDSVLWWLITLRAYTQSTGDTGLADREDFRTAIHLILELTLEGSFELFPTLLVPDGSFMIDRRLGVYGHPLSTSFRSRYRTGSTTGFRMTARATSPVMSAREGSTFASSPKATCSPAPRGSPLRSSAAA